MKTLKIITAIFIVFQVYSCTGKSSPQTTSADTTSSSTATDETTSPLIDTGKLQSDFNDIITSVTSGNPDTTKLKNAAGDIMQTDASVLSDSGIDKMYVNNNDPSVTAAKNALKKMRGGVGITPDKSDSIKKEADKLKSSH